MNLDLSPLYISLKTASVATFFALISGVTVARWMFSYRGKARGILDGVFTLPLVLPPTVVGFLLLLLLGRNSPVGQFLKQLGITIIFSWYAAVIAATVVAFPLMYKTVLGAFEQVNKDLIACAKTLGASDGRVFWQIILPLAWPGIISGTILSFARALGEFGATLMLAGSIPGKTETIPIAIFFASEAGNMEEAFIWVIIVIIITLAAIASINYLSNSPNLSQTGFINYCSIIINRYSTIISRWLLILPQIPIQIPPFLRLAPGDRIIENGTDNKQELLVNIEKHFSSFTLNSNFTANHQPLGLLGSSGSGKSMTLRCIAGLETPSRGKIILNGRVLFDSEQKINLPPHQRRIGFVFQNYALFPHMKVAQNIGFGLHELSISARQERVWKYIELMQLQGLEKRYPHQLSGGQQQRVALARALAIAPEAILLDEPLSALDNYLRSQIEKLLAEVFSNYGGITLFVTHKLEEAYRVCGNLLILSQGKVIASGRKEDIFEHPPNFTVAQVTECKNFSRAQIIDNQSIAALDWGCRLEVIQAIPNSLTYVGIRAHHLTFPPESDGENTFTCWLVTTSETQHRISLYLKLNSPPTNSQDYHLQAEIFKEKWAELKNRPLPWYLKLEPLRLILMER